MVKGLKGLKDSIRTVYEYRHGQYCIKGKGLKVEEAALKIPENAQIKLLYGF